MSNDAATRKALREKLDRQYQFDLASQIPVNATKESYNRMMGHCIVQTDGKIQNRWACVLTGAPVKGRMVMRSVYKRESGEFLEVLPVIELYCKNCHAVPTTQKLASVWDSDIQTLSM